MKSSISSSPLKLSYLLFFVVFTSGFLPGCHKTSKNESPKPTTGSISGVITPTDGAISVVAQPAGGGQSSSVSLQPNGVFEIENLSPGNYTITVIPTAGFLVPTSISTNVVAGQASNVGQIIMPLDPNGGSVSFTIGGNQYTITSNQFISCTFSIPAFSLSAQTANLKLSDGYIVSFYLGDVNNTGTYSITSASSSARIGQYSGANEYFWSTLRGGATGTITITTLNTETHRATGTFVLDLVPESLLEKSNIISYGSFTNVFFP